MSKTNPDIRNDEQLQLLASMIKNLRLNENLTQDEVANALHLHRNTIIHVESGRPFSVSILLQFADFYQIRLSELFTGFL